MGKWTEEEVRILKDNLLDTAAEIQVLLKGSRSIEGICRKRRQFHKINPGWTKDEVLYLRKLAVDHTAKECSRLLPGHSTKSVRAKSYDLGLTLKRVGAGPRPWSKEDLDTLRFYSKTKTFKEAALLLDRTYASTKKKAGVEGISFNAAREKSAWSGEDLATLIKYYGRVSLKDMVDLISGRSLYSIKHKAQRLQIERKYNPNRWHPVAEEYMRNNYGKRSVQEIAKHLDKTRGAVHRRAKILGLTKKSGPKRKWTRGDEMVLYRKAGTISAKGLAKILDRTREAVSHRAASLGISLELDLYDLNELELLLNAPDEDPWFNSHVWAGWRHMGLEFRKNGHKCYVSATLLAKFWRQRPEAVNIYELLPETLEELNINLDTWPEPPAFKIIACTGSKHRIHSPVLNCVDLYATGSRCVCGAPLDRWAHAYSEECITPPTKVQTHLREPEFGDPPLHHEGDPVFRNQSQYKKREKQKKMGSKVEL